MDEGAQCVTMTWWAKSASAYRDEAQGHVPANHGRDEHQGEHRHFNEVAPALDILLGRHP